jgi:hypothetical protein
VQFLLHSEVGKSSADSSVIYASDCFATTALPSLGGHPYVLTFTDTHSLLKIFKLICSLLVSDW